MDYGDCGVNVISCKTTRWNKIIYLILGITVFSRLSSYILLDLAELPIYFIEFPLILFSIIKYKNVILWVRKLFAKKSLVVLYIALAFILVVLFSWKRTGSLYETLSVSRGFLYIVIFAALSAVREKEFSYDFLYYISLGAVIGDLISQLFVANYVEAIKLNNLLTASLVVMLPIIYGKKLHIIVSVPLTLFISFYSGYRIALLVFFLALLITLLSLMIRRLRPARFKLSDLFVSAAAIVVVANIQRIADSFLLFMTDIVRMDNYAYYRVTKRFIQALTLNFDASRDLSRFQAYSKLYTSFFDHIIPEGLGGRDIGIGIYYDMPMMYLYNSIGSLFTWLIILTMLWKVIPRFLKALVDIKRSTDSVIVLSFPILCALFLLNARFFLITYESIVMGLILGRILKR